MNTLSQEDMTAPYPGISWAAWWMVSDSLRTDGHCYLWTKRDDDNVPNALRPVHPRHVTSVDGAYRINGELVPSGDIIRISSVAPMADETPKWENHFEKYGPLGSRGTK